MFKVKVFTLDSFTKNSRGGNPAGVVLYSDGLSNHQMLEIAKIVGFSETAFVQQSNKADFRLRFFTPNNEVDLCGHATIAAFYLMAVQQIIKPGSYTQETKSGILGIDVLPDNTIFMNQKIPQFYETINRDLISKSLNIGSDYLCDDLPVQIVSTGLKDILIPIKSLKNLTDIKPDFEEIKEITRKFNSVGYHLFSLETVDDSVAHCRNFAPLYHIKEESATGTSNGALCCYLFNYGKINRSMSDILLFEQGYSMNSPSEIRVKLKTDNITVESLQVGGCAGNIRQTEVVIQSIT